MSKSSRETITTAAEIEARISSFQKLLRNGDSKNHNRLTRRRAERLRTSRTIHITHKFKSDGRISHVLCWYQLPARSPCVSEIIPAEQVIAVLRESPETKIVTAGLADEHDPTVTAKSTHGMKSGKGFWLLEEHGATLIESLDDSRRPHVTTERDANRTYNNIGNLVDLVSTDPDTAVAATYPHSWLGT